METLSRHRIPQTRSQPSICPAAMRHRKSRTASCMFNSKVGILESRLCFGIRPSGYLTTPFSTCWDFNPPFLPNEGNRVRYLMMHFPDIVPSNRSCGSLVCGCVSPLLCDVVSTVSQRRILKQPFVVWLDPTSRTS